MVGVNNNERIKIMKKEYVYYHEETTTDTRSWTVRTKSPMSAEEVQEICYNQGTDDNYDTYESSSTQVNPERYWVLGGTKVEYHGTDYGDDAVNETFLDGELVEDE
jgi:hypothetical protein